MDELLKKLNSVGAETEDTLERFMNDKEMYLKYLLQFPEEKTMKNLIEAVENEDYEQAEKSVHAFKGIVNNLGFIPLADAAIDMLEELRDNNIEAGLDAFEDLKDQYKIFCEVIVESIHSI